MLLVDRYKYLDLYPCSKTELAVLGYEVRSIIYLLQFKIDNQKSFYQSIKQCALMLPTLL